MITFNEFYEELTGHQPFAWQRRLVDRVADTGQWPASVHAPTGTGKSAVVEAHIFLNAAHGLGQVPRVPRRLAVCVNRRAIVDQHFEAARKAAEKLSAASDGVLKHAAAGLRKLQAENVVARARGEATDSAPLWVANLRGGVSPTREWLHDLSTCGVIAVTPDMWGSRALFQGYGVRPQARSREAAALVMDTALVIDEAHLSRQLTHTAREVERQVGWQSVNVGVPGLQVVTTTATPSASADQSVGVTPDDIESEPILRQRLEARKPVSYVEVPAIAGGRAPAGHIKALVQQALELEAILPSSDLPATVGVFVNRVDTAVRVAAELRRECGREAVAVWVGRMRPMDVAAARTETPGLFEVSGDASVRFLVATQTVEAGVDLDLAGLVTELAPAPDLVQRLGRINRLGQRSEAPVTVVGPPRQSIKDYSPYSEDELTAGLSLVESALGTDQGLSPSTVLGLEVPPRKLRRVLTTVRAVEVADFSRTSDLPAEAEELRFWLRDDLEDEEEPVSIVMRAHLPASDDVAVALLSATPPVADEMYPVRIGEAQRLLKEVLSEEAGRLFVWDGEIAQSCGIDEVRPGAVFIIDVRPVTVAGVLGPDAPYDTQIPRTYWADTDEVASDGVRRVILVRGRDDALLDEVGVVEDAEVDGWVESTFGGGLTSSLGPRDDWGELQWLVALGRSEVASDEVVRQEFSPSVTAVGLDQHSRNVAAQAAVTGRALGLSGELVNALETAGEWHDAGKRDRRFQVFVLGGDGETLLAKSDGLRPQQIARRRGSSPLPTGWRHEQLSVALAAAALGVEGNELCLRLVGTSHGHGRLMFPMGASDLLAQEDHFSQDVRVAALDLFETHRGWSVLVEHTDGRFGPWGIAFLEAVLRSADGLVSKEGS